MAGEMNWIRPDGTDDSGYVWVTHAAIAKAVGGQLQPFDQYQGPYIVIGADLVAESPPYSIPMHYLGVIRLWVCMGEDDLVSQVYREDTEETSPPFLSGDTDAAIAAAQSLLTKKPDLEFVEEEP